MSAHLQIKTEFLIVGQGLAGTLLAYFLQLAGKQVYILDDDYPRSASKVAAGIINPVTGRRYVKSWRIDELIPVAERTYRDLEALLDSSFFHSRSILRALFGKKEENDWQVRAFTPAYQNYVLPKKAVALDQYQGKIVPAFDYGELAHGAQVDIGRLVKQYRKHCLEAGIMSECVFTYDQLELLDSGIRYQNIQADILIFCEGAKAKQNPFFSHLPYEGNKGEAFLVDIPQADFQKILKQNIFIVPLANGKYWIGSTSNNFYSDDMPSSKGKNYLLEKLADLLLVPFIVEDHRAAIRPTVKDRRPLIGRHPDCQQLFIFNGLGTKGASLGPYWAHHLTEVLTNGHSIDPEVDISRFYARSPK